MKNEKLRLTFGRYTDADLEVQARLILESMTGNPAFASPIPTLADITAATDAYSTALTKAAGLGRTNVAEKNKAREKLEKLLSQLGMYVMYIANGDKATLVSSGFTLAKERENREITNPGAVSLKSGISSGELVTQVKSVKGAKSYLHEYAEDMPEGELSWTSNPSSESKMVFSGLQPGRKYHVRIGAIGKGAQVAYSPVNSMYVQ